MTTPNFEEHVSYDRGPADIIENYWTEERMENSKNVYGVMELRIVEQKMKKFEIDDPHEKDVGFCKKKDWLVSRQFEIMMENQLKEEL